MTTLLFAEFGFHFLLFRFENLCRILIIQQYICHRVFGHFQCFCKVRGIIYLWNCLSDFCEQIKDLLSAKELTEPVHCAQAPAEAGSSVASLMPMVLSSTATIISE